MARGYAGAAPLGFPAPRVGAVFERLYACFGPQHWWPGETPFEVMVGAVLTQNTAWSNVERAIDRLNGAQLLDAERLAALPLGELASLIQSAGYFNVKARRLQSLCGALVAAGGEAALGVLPTAELRAWLLGVHGVGPETADDILLYAFQRPVFVVDAYTRRVFERLGLLAGGEGYEAIRAAFEAALPPEVALFNEYHALLVRQGKAVCRTRPRCGDCALASGCPVPGPA